MRIASLTVLCLVLAAIPAVAGTQVSYDNGPPSGTTDAWTINFGYVVSNTFSTGPEGTGMNSVTSFQFYAWESPGAVMSSLGWSITDSENSPCPSDECLGNGTATQTGGQGGTLSDKYISTNQYGYNIDLINATLFGNGQGGGIGVPEGVTLWLNLQNAVQSDGSPVYWDENSGVGCGGYQGNKNCPSDASESAVGTIPSEAFTVTGLQTPQGSTPEPSTIMLFGSGVLGLAGLMRRKLF